MVRPLVPRQEGPWRPQGSFGTRDHAVRNPPAGFSSTHTACWASTSSYAAGNSGALAVPQHIPAQSVGEPPEVLMTPRGPYSLSLSGHCLSHVSGSSYTEQQA